MRRIALVAVIGAILASVSVSAPASATTTVWKTISADPSQTFVDGVTATASLSNGAVRSDGYSVSPFNAPELLYKTMETADSQITISFSSSAGGWSGISDLKLYYGWVNLGDEVTVSTNVAPSGIDFTDSSIATLSSYLCTGDCGGTGTLTSAGFIGNDMVTGSRYNGQILLHFATPITSITVKSVNPRTRAGQNGFGFQIPVEVPTATFHGNGSTSGSMTSYYSESSHALPSNAFTKDGYTFAGWNSADDGTGTDSFDDGDTFDFSADIDLYAQWSADSHVITYSDSDSGTPHSGGDSTYLTDGSFTLPTAPRRDGYTFAGWQISGDHVTTEVLDPAATTASPNGYGAITLTATWVVDAAGGGSGSGTGGTSTLAQTGFNAPTLAFLALSLIVGGAVLDRMRRRQAR